MTRDRRALLRCWSGAALSIVLWVATAAARADQAPAGDVTVRLVDATTRAPLARQAVEVFSDNGVRCIKAPCPTNAKTWKGTTDAQGRVKVPGRVVQESTRIRALPDGEWAEVAAEVAVRRKP